MHVMLPALVERMERQGSVAEYGATEGCFQIFGFDIMCDTDLKPWLIEVNNNPSLNIKSTYGLNELSPEERIAALATPVWKMGDDGEISGDGVCNCMSYHGQHVHRICACDVHIKTHAVGGALAMVLLSREDSLSGSNGQVGGFVGVGEERSADGPV